MTPLAIAGVQLLYLIALYVPMGWHRLGLPKSLRVGLGYLVANALALLVGYTLDMAGWFSVTRLFVVWLGLCTILNLLAYRKPHPFRYPARAKQRIHILLAVTWIVSVGIRLVDPLLNAALAGTDCYQFLNFYAWLLGEQQAVHDYPSGFALVTAMAPWTIQPYAAVRWAPHLVFLACLPAAFGLWQRMGGLRLALAITVLLGSAWFLYPISAYHPHFIQWTTVFIGLPALLTIYARLSRGEPPLPLILLAIPVNIAFTMTAAYFALYLNVILPLLVVVTNLRGRALLSRMLSSAVIALIPPLTLLAYYGILARYFFPYGTSGILTQTQLVSDASQAATAVAEPLRAIVAGHARPHPMLMVITAFLSPTGPLIVGPRWVVYTVIIALGCWLWHRSRARRLTAMHLLAGLMIVSTCSAMTGIFELPDWQGRNVFIALYTGLAAVLWTVITRFPTTLRQVRHSPVLLLVAFLCVAGPSMYSPPMIGRNVPVADVIQPRNLPSDNQVMAELIRTPEAHSVKKRLAVVTPVDTASRSHLIGNLLRLKDPHPRTYAVPGYHIIALANPLDAFECDAVLIPTPMLNASPLPDTFVVHTTGRDYVFAIRKDNVE